MMEDGNGHEVLVKTTDYLYDNNGNELREKVSYVAPYTSGMRQVTGGNLFGNSIRNPIKPLIESVSHTFDGFNRLVETENIKSGERSTVDLVYNGDGLRTKKTVRSSKAGYTAKITNYIYDRQHVILETDGANLVSVRYVRGLNYIARMDASNKLSYYLFNGHGDVVQTVSSIGIVENRYEYDIWGNATLTIEQYANTIRYSGEFYDAKTGLYYLRARYYNPYTGRFISADSVWGEDTNPLSLNLYTYAENDPIQFSDPTGHFCESADGKYSHPGKCSSSTSIYTPDKVAQHKSAKAKADNERKYLDNIIKKSENKGLKSWAKTEMKKEHLDGNTSNSSQSAQESSPQHSNHHASSSSVHHAHSSPNSIVDYLNKNGESSSFNHRKELAAQYGIANYKGTSAQDLELMKKMKSGKPEPQVETAETVTQEVQSSPYPYSYADAYSDTNSYAGANSYPYSYANAYDYSSYYSSSGSSSSTNTSTTADTNTSQSDGSSTTDQNSVKQNTENAPKKKLYQRVWNSVTSFAYGTGDAVVSNLTLGKLKSKKGSNDQYKAYYAGRVVGDTITAFIGDTEIKTGGTAAIGGTALDATGVGAIPGVLVQAAGAAVATQGVMVTGTSIKSFSNDAGYLFSKDKSGSSGSSGSGSGSSGSSSKGAGKSGPYSHLEDPENVGPGKDFTPSQRRNIIEENKRNNGGQVKSDDPNDIAGRNLVKPSKSQKGVTPPENEWQIDHIVPKDKGGTNSYSNAQVLSRKQNRIKSND